MNNENNDPVLAVDLGGTKIAIARVQGSRITEQHTIPTPRSGHPDDWIVDIKHVSEHFSSGFKGVAIAVTGQVNDGKWSSRNPETLNIPFEYPLRDKLREALDCPVLAINDAMAASWGEYRFGAGHQQDIVFLTVSTGVGGGVVTNGRILTGCRGLAGSFGQMLINNPLTGQDEKLENLASGRWIARMAKKQASVNDARDVFRLAIAGEIWADEILNASAKRIATLCYNLKLIYDPYRIVIGGGVGMAEGYLNRLQFAYAEIDHSEKIEIVPAHLTNNAGLLGVADLMNNQEFTGGI